MSTLAAALALAARGLRVFPLRPNGKRPAIDAFPAVATTDAETIRAWWRDPATGGEYNYNVGVLTTGFVVVDVDVKRGKEGLGSYLAHGGHWDTFVVQTPTGGYHCYFNGPDSKLAANVFPGVDIRSHNGYVVGPGSVIDGGAYELIADKPFAPVPLEVELVLEPPGRRERRDGNVELDKATSIDNAAVWLQTAEPAVEGMGGDDRTYRTAAKLVRDYALTPDTAFKLLADYWNYRCSPPWELDELWRKVQNAAEYATGDLGTETPEAYFGAVQHVPPPPPPQPQELGIYRGNAVEPSLLTPRPWIVDRLLVRGALTVLAAAGGTGKSLLQLVLAAHAAVGRDFGVYKLHNAGAPLVTILYNAEDDIQEQSRRLWAVCAAYELDYNTVKQNLVFIGRDQLRLRLVNNQQGTPMMEVQTIQSLIDICHQNDASLLMLDPLVKLHTCNENDNSAMNFVCEVLEALASAAGVAVLVSHHVGKGGGKLDKGDSGAIRGASGIVDASRISIMLSGPEEADRETYGILDDERAKFVRIDDAKTNLYARSTNAIMWMEWLSLRIPTSDLVGVLKPAEMETRKAAEAERIASILYVTLLSAASGSISVAHAVTALQAEDALYGQMPTATVRAHLEKMFRLPCKVADGQAIQFVRVKRKNGTGDEMTIQLKGA